MKKTIVVILLIICKLLVSQETPVILKDSITQNRISHYVQKYDSTVLLDISNFFNDSFEIKGFSYRNNRIFKRHFVFRYDSVTDNYKVQNLKRKRIKSPEIENQLNEIYFQDIIYLNNDSLNYRILKNGINVKALADGNILTLLIFDRDSKHLKQVYEPEYFQKFVYVQDREYFLKISNTLLKLLK